MDRAKVFKSGNSLAVRLPLAFRVNAKELEIFRRGDEIVLREPRKRGDLLEALDLLAAMPEDAVEAIIDRRPPQTREGL
jgi:antitoxin VapB